MATILVVDDLAVNRELLTTLLRYPGHQVEEAADGAEALDAVRARHPDLVIADILMPTMDGFEFVRRLREEPAIAGTEVIFYTANYHREQAAALARQCGVRYLLTKPTERQEILDTVDAALAGSPAAPPAAPAGAEFDSRHVRVLTDKLASITAALERTNAQLVALIDLGHRLGAEGDPVALLQEFCGTGRRIIGAKTAGLGILGPEGQPLAHFVTSGISRTPRSTTPPQNEGVLARVAADRSGQRIHGLRDDAALLGIPEGYPPAASFLAAPVAAPDRAYGWIFFTDCLGSESFSAADQRLAEALGAAVGVAYENAARCLELRRHSTELERINHELEAFSYSVSHDLRAPLRAVSGFATALGEDEQIDAGGREYLGYIQENARTMGALLDSLLAFSRAGRSPMRTTGLNMTALVRSAFAEAEREAPDRTVRLRLRPLPRAEGDGTLIRQALKNLLSNAVKFTRDSETPEIEVSGRPTDEGIEYCVRDNGAGFDMRYIDRLFGVFQRLHSQEEFEGTGMGLSIVRRIIHRHDGKVRAEGRPGEGAAFYFTLPEPGAGHGRHG